VVLPDPGLGETDATFELQDATLSSDRWYRFNADRWLRGRCGHLSNADIVGYNIVFDAR
jgi:hypothetical protein